MLRFESSPWPTLPALRRRIPTQIAKIRKYHNRWELLRWIRRGRTAARHTYAHADDPTRVTGGVVVVNSRQPLYQMKADFFKTLGHPARIRVLELLSEREHAVSEMLPEVGIEPANLSQQLSILRRAGLVTARREGLSVSYALTSPRVADLLTTARAILTGMVAGQAEMLVEEIPEPPALAGKAR
jgi:DNA-binding transcriptional ArsR family regulator